MEARQKFDDKFKRTRNERLETPGLWYHDTKTYDHDDLEKQGKRPNM